VQHDHVEDRVLNRSFGWRWVMGLLPAEGYTGMALHWEEEQEVAASH
jgi:hypothetical protein